MNKNFEQLNQSKKISDYEIYELFSNNFRNTFYIISIATILFNFYNASKNKVYGKIKKITTIILIIISLGIYLISYIYQFNIMNKLPYHSINIEQSKLMFKLNLGFFSVASIIITFILLLEIYIMFFKGI